MKGLLHSKTFRENLYKWLILYVGIMLLLTTVITYSRYISKFHGEGDKADAARFHIEIKELNCRNSKTGGSCNLDSYWATEPIEYYFLVDTTDVDISATEFITIKLHSNFDIKHAYAIDLEKEGVMQNGEIVDLDNLDCVELPIDKTTTGGSIVLSESEFTAGKGKIKGYRVVIKQKEDIKQENDSYTYDELLKINYLAEQKN